MANYIGYCRSNYFPVKDLTAFNAALPPTVRIEHRRGEVAVFPEYGWTGFDEDDREFNITEVISAHIVPGHIAICQEVGHEKLRYLIGYVLAVSSRGVEMERSIDIAGELREALPDYVITDPTY